MNPFHLVLMIHGHQPVGNFDNVFEHAYRDCYLPFLEALDRHPGVRLGLHLSGPLCEWIVERHPEYFTRLTALVSRGQVEMIGGGFYEPILISIPPGDRSGQIVRMADFLFERFAARPEGLWLTERVWEPHLAESLAAAGVGYTLVDDNHFIMAGFEPENLFGYYRVEELGAGIDVFPGLETLRYLVPFRPVEENVDFLRRSAAAHPGGMAAMGDDIEKFGVWPGTYAHVHGEGWLDRFFQALEANSDWLQVTTPGAYRRTNPPLGSAALPTASYREMTQWSLATPARHRLESLIEEFAARPDLLRFLSGGPWRNFLVKYPEANLLSKRMQHVSRRLAERENQPARAQRERLANARTHLMRSQCNDAYWHGVFGGLYAPHLRNALWRELIAAERLLDAAEAQPRSQRIAVGACGREEVYFTSERYAALLQPADGATVAALDFRSAGAALINSVARRPEAYHAKLAKASEAAATVPDGTVSIHDLVHVKEPGLQRLLRYDRWARHCFRLLLFSTGKQPADYSALTLDEEAALAGGPFELKRLAADEAELHAECSIATLAETSGGHLSCNKSFHFQPIDQGFAIRGAVRLLLAAGETLTCRAGIELVLNFLSPNSGDRYFAVGAERQPLRWEGVAPGTKIELIDNWQKIAASIIIDRAGEFWIAPIETVTESEGGFERVYQGSQILAVWPLDLREGQTWEANVDLRLRAL